MTETPDVRLLLACLRPTPPAEVSSLVDTLDQSAWQNLVRVAAEQRVRPLVHDSLNRLGLRSRIPADVWERLETASRQTALRTFILTSELAALAREMNSRGVPLIPLKGVYLAHAVYQNAALRELNDLDVLVPRAHVRSVIDFLKRRGYASSGPIDLDKEMAVHHHAQRLIKPGAGGVEIHWGFTPPNTAYSIDCDAFWRRATRAHVGQATVSALEPVDLLLYLCAHALYGHRFEFGFRPLCDVAATVGRFSAEIDWLSVVARANECCWTRGVHMVLRLAVEYAGAEVPPSVLDATLGDCDAEILEAARRHLLTDKSALANVGEVLTHLARSEPLSTKAIRLRKRLTAHAVQFKTFATSSPRARFGYAVKCGNFIRTYLPIGFQMWMRPDSEALQIAQRKARLNDWLDRS